jgi:hypothetical protein
MPMLHVRLTEPEMEAVKAAAHAAGLSLSAHLRTVIFPALREPALSVITGIAKTRLKRDRDAQRKQVDAVPFVHPRLGVAALRESEPLPPEPAKPPRPSQHHVEDLAHYDACLLTDPNHDGPCKVPPQVAQAISAAERAHRTHAILERAAHSKPRPPR